MSNEFAKLDARQVRKKKEDQAARQAQTSWRSLRTSDKRNGERTLSGDINWEKWLHFHSRLLRRPRFRPEGWRIKMMLKNAVPHAPQ